MSKPWIGVDLDGTLAEYDQWRGERHIGAPIPLMLNRVRVWLSRGMDVKIVTARMAPGTNKDGTPRDIEGFQAALREWCIQHIGVPLEVTNAKDFSMVELWDDRAIQVVSNTGDRIDAVQDTRTAAAIRTLEGLGYTWQGGIFWKPSRARRRA